MNIDINNLAWDKSNGLLPAIVQDAKSSQVLMLGYMNKDALEKTLELKQVTFYSRSKNKLWTKGETSGNRLDLVAVRVDCDNDTLLVSATPAGPICHTGTETCFGGLSQTDWAFIQELEDVIQLRAQSTCENSYTASLMKEGVSRIAQKVGEEAVEVAIAAIDRPNNELCEEVADLFFHLLILLKAKKLSISDIIQVLRDRRS
jgi:phosphoribosyl-ATP pyrophosphohydrolase/phosphoribosyl-AMP cyclohydrolase